MSCLKEAWYDGYKAKNVYENVWYVFKNCWADPIYVLAAKEVNVPVFGLYIEGQKVTCDEVRDWFSVEYGEEYEPTPQEIAEVVRGILDTIGEAEA